MHFVAPFFFFGYLVPILEVDELGLAMRRVLGSIFRD